MQSVEQLLRTLDKVQSLRARAGTPGEERAAAEAEGRILARLRAMTGGGFAAGPRERPREEPQVMHRFSIGDPWSQDLFRAMLQREGLSEVRYPRQQRNTVRVRAPRDTMDRLWREFRKLQSALLDEINRISRDFVRDTVLASAARSPFRR
jgi:hypothetical protein